MSTNTPQEEPIPESEIIARIIQAQIGTPSDSDLITEHMKEYFQRWPKYYPLLSDLEWYHVFLDFLDKVNAASKLSQKAAPHPEDVKEVEKTILDSLNTHLRIRGVGGEYISGKKDAAEYLALWMTGFWSAMDEGVDQWKADYENLKAKVEAQKAAPRMRWVKASERLPENGIMVIIRPISNRSLAIAAAYTGDASEWATDSSETWWLDDTEWLEETPAAPSKPIQEPFDLSPEDIQKLLDRCLKPDEIGGDAAIQQDRVRELVRWFRRYADGSASAKWLTAHAFELAYYIATSSGNRFIDLDAIREKAYYEGVNITPKERGFIERQLPDRITKRPIEQQTPEDKAIAELAVLNSTSDHLSRKPIEEEKPETKI